MTTETEVRFLEIDKTKLVEKLLALGAKDFGETMLEEIIFNGTGSQEPGKRWFIRIRKKGTMVVMTYKKHKADPKDGAEELELKIDNLESGVEFLEKLGLPAFRRQQKLRHTLQLGGVTMDFDTWPKIPTYVELEGPTMEDIKRTAKILELDWSKVVYEDAKSVIENVYHIPVGSMRWFTFEKME